MLVNDGEELGGYVRTRRAGARAFIGAPLASVLSLISAIQALRLWEWKPGTPFELGGDATFFTVQIGELIRSGTLDGSERLGAPFGQNSGWFPSDDHLHYAIVRTLGLFIDSPFTVAAVYFIVGFPASALTAYWLMRQVGASRLAAIPCSVLFSVLPGHQDKFEHIWLAAYWVLPLGLWLVLAVGMGRPLFTRVDRHSGRPDLMRSLWANARTVLIVISVALGGVYYLAFTLILLLVVMAYRTVSGERRSLLAPVGVVASMLTFAAIAIASSSRGRAADLVTGSTPARRSPTESEFFAGKFMDLVLPWREHRIDVLRIITQAYNMNPDSTVESAALGVVALVGVAFLVWMAIRRLIAQDTQVSPVLAPLSGLTLVSLAVYTKGGLGSFIAIFATPQLRTWSRMYLVIGLLGLMAVALLLTAVQRRRGIARFAPLAALVLVVGVFDQTNPNVAPDYDAARTSIDRTVAFTNDLEQRLPKGCAVFQLPVVKFPESRPPYQMRDYDHLLPYLTSESLKWSYGAMRGTSRADWQLGLPLHDVGELASDLAAADFCAVEVDTAGYAAHKDPSRELSAVAGEPIGRSTDGRLLAFDLQALRAELIRNRGTTAVEAQGWNVLHPLVVEAGGYDPHVQDGKVMRWLGPRGSVTVMNMTGTTVHDVIVSLSLRAPNQRAWTVTLHGTDGHRRAFHLAEGSVQTVTVTADVPPGRSTVSLSTNPDALSELPDRRKVSGLLTGVSISAPNPALRTSVAPWPQAEAP